MTGSLRGLKVLDFSTLLPGPMATLFLAEAGAEGLRLSDLRRAKICDIIRQYGGIAALISRF